MLKKKNIIFGLLALPVLTTLVGRVNYDEKANALNTALSNFEEVDIQDQLFKVYYDDLNDDVKEKVSLEKFKGIYKQEDIKANELVDKLNHYDFKTVGNTTQIKGGIPAFIEDIGTDAYRTYDDAFYIISDNHNGHGYGVNEKPLPLKSYYNGMTYSSDASSTRSFDFGDYSPNVPTYATNNFNRYKSLFRFGDLVWDGVSRNTSDDNDVSTHMGMIVNTDKTGTRNGVTFNYIETIEAYASGVRFGYLDDERILKEGTKVLRVDSTYQDRLDARDFMYSQLGKDYTLRIPDINLNGVPVPNGNASTWYCTQLVVSAYYSTGINICEVNGNENYYGKNGKVYFNVIGDMIYRSFNISVVSFQNDHPLNQFLELDVRGFDGTNYTVDIKNNTSSARMVGYTPQKRSFGSLAVNPIDQSLRFINIAANSTQRVKIYGDGSYAIQAFYLENKKLHCTIAHRMMEVGYYTKSSLWCLEFNYISTIGNSNSDDVKTERTYYPKLFVDSKSGSTWKIGVANLSTFVFNSNNFEYNSKMCNSGDAKNWTGLKDVKSGTVSKNSFTLFEVKENFWATHIAFSVKRSGTRYIGYGDCLNSSKKTMAFYQNTKSL